MGINKSKYITFERYIKVGHIIGHFEGWYEDDNEKRFESLQHAVDDGLNIALYYLAYCYEFGVYIEMDCSKAFELYKQSSENEFIPSQYELAKCFRYGEGIQENKKEALKWYKLYQENDGIYDVSDKIKDIERELVDILCFYFDYYFESMNQRN